jgi:hypothetical protein
MGVVYLAIDTRLDRKLALEVMLPQAAEFHDPASFLANEFPLECMPRATNYEVTIRMFPFLTESFLKRVPSVE